LGLYEGEIERQYSLICIVIDISLCLNRSWFKIGRHE